MIGDRIVNSLNPKDRDIAMVFQNYALYPHMTVRENMEFSLALRRFKKPERVARVDAIDFRPFLTPSLAVMGSGGSGPQSGSKSPDFPKVNRHKLPRRGSKRFSSKLVCSALKLGNRPWRRASS